MTTWKTKKVNTLCEAILSFSTIAEFANFLRDLLTEPEIKEFADRFAVAQLLAEGTSQREVAKETGVSIATVTRVNQWLQRGTGGYKQAILSLKTQSHHHHKA